MDKMRIFIDEQTGIEHVIIDREDGSQLSMLKSTYDEMIKAQDEAKTI